VYWVESAIHENEIRGNHAHKTSVQVVVAMRGEVKIELEDAQGAKFSYHLKDSSEGLLIPPMYWRKLFLEKDGSCLCFASKEYSEEDYIREYSVFKQ
jgi:dTDP-4-dehydrorhamnose 3,5-epimerase-like enzyme